MDWLSSSSVTATIGLISLVLSLVGFPLTVIGLRLTYLQAQRAETAAEASSRAVREFKDQVDRQAASRDVSQAMYAIDVTRQHLRNDAWNDAATSYEDARRALVRLQEQRGYVQENQRERFAAMLDHMSAFCDAVDAYPTGKSKLPDKSKVFSAIRENYQILVSVRNALERGPSDV
jgi:DNA-binding MurR/RpiR family transcriptional regulator